MPATCEIKCSSDLKIYRLHFVVSFVSTYVYTWNRFWMPPLMYLRQRLVQTNWYKFVEDMSEYVMWAIVYLQVNSHTSQEF